MRDQHGATDRGGTSPDPRRAAERVLEDETLRGDLSDDGYQPLLEVTLALADLRVHMFSDTDSLSQAMRSFIRDAVAFVEWRDDAAREAFAESALLLPSERPAIRALCLPADADAAGIALAQAIGRIAGLTDGS
jgi:hypothetical protein